MDAPTQTAMSGTTDTVTSTVLAAATPPSVLEMEAESTEHAETAGKPVGFTGLFFRCVAGRSGRVDHLTVVLSTFFGGHEDRYASPKDQFTWFKDFSMTING